MFLPFHLIIPTNKAYFSAPANFYNHKKHKIISIPQKFLQSKSPGGNSPTFVPLATFTKITFQMSPPLCHHFTQKTLNAKINS